MAACYCLDVLQDIVGVAGLELSDVDHHIDLIGAVPDGLCRLKCLGSS